MIHNKIFNCDAKSRMVLPRWPPFTFMRESDKISYILEFVCWESILSKRISPNGYWFNNKASVKYNIG